jgi:hypothetical protein
MSSAAEDVVRDVLEILGPLVPEMGIYLAKDYLLHNEVLLGIESAFNVMVDDDVALTEDVANAVLARLRMFFDENKLVEIKRDLAYLVRNGESA